MLTKINFLTDKGGDNDCADYHRAKDNSVPAEHLEIVFLHELHKPFNRHHRNDKGNERADKKISDFRAREHTEIE